MDSPPGATKQDIEADVLLDQVRARMFGRSVPVRLGRFSIGAMLGRGAHGNVYLAEDVELKRRVALKIIRAEGDSNLHARLLREAQALAQLKHPNVLTVHDVGVEGDRIFIAMEYVEEGTLAQWSAAHPPGSRGRFLEVLRLAIGAARGLAVAHEAGIVHRDVKPANILVGADGRPRLADFGLARATATAAPSSDDIYQPRGSPSAAITAREALTSTGAVIGTPMYMAPEQFDGRADAASDQWGLCAALWEVAYGERPFNGDDLHTLALAVSGPPRSPPRARAEVPGWWRTILTRGLSPDPSARWPSVGDLADALQRATTRQRRRRMAAVGIGAVAMGVVGVGVWQLDLDRRRARCERDADEIEGSWNDQVRAQVRDAMLATEVRYARTSFEHAVPHLASYAERWRGMYAELCTATLVDGTRADAQWTASRVCLDERRVELTALLGVLSEDVDARTVENAVLAVTSLGQLDPCADGSRPTMKSASSTDADAVAELRQSLWRARALEAAGRYESGRAVAQALVERTVEHPSVRMRVRARQVAGDLAHASGHYDDARRLQGEAFDDALAMGELDLAVDAATDLAYVVGSDLEEHEHGLLWSRVASGLLTSLGGEDGLAAASLWNNVGSIQAAQGQPAEAEQSHERALRIRERVLGPDHPLLAQSLDSLGVAQAMQGRYEDARPVLERALTLRERALGPDHPLLASSYSNLGQLFDRKGDYEQSERVYRKAIEISVAALGPEHVDVGAARQSLARLHVATGQYDEAEQGLLAALAIHERTLGSEHPDVGDAQLALGALYEQQGRWEEGLRARQRALEILRAGLGPDHPRVAGAYIGLGNIHRLRGSLAEAEQAYTRAREIMEAAEGLDPSQLAIAEASLGNVYLQQRRFDESVLAHRRAIAIWEKAVGPDHVQCGAAHLGVGNVHLARGALDEAEEAYERARTIFEKTLGAEHFNVGLVHGNLGDVHTRRGDHAAAVRAHAKSAAIVEAATGPSNPEVAASLRRLASAHLAQGERAQAAKAATRALALKVERGAEPLELAGLRFLLAQAIWTANSEEGARARALATQAADACRAAGESSREDLAEVERWLDRHR